MVKTRNKQELTELYWLNKSEYEITIEQIQRFEKYFSKKKGYEVAWCEICKSFDVAHNHLKKLVNE